MMISGNLSELYKEAQSLHSEWQKYILAISSGFFALLIGLGPKVPPTGISKYFLAVAWICLGIGIISGAAAIYTEVDRANRIFTKYREELARNPERKAHLTVLKPTVARQSKFFSSIAPRAMVISFLTAVVLLVVYSVMIALNS